jgi:cytochrome c peroxidase
MLAALGAAGLVALVACASSVKAPLAEAWPTAASLAPPKAPADNPLTPVKAELGRMLFYDGDLSWDGTMSCATCHEQKRGFTDPNKTRAGFDGQPGERNIQTLANISYFSSLTWGGPQVDTLEHQALVPIEGINPVEMGFGGMNRDGVLPKRLADQACYPRMFAAAFPEKGGEISMDTIAMALAAFQRTLVSLDAPYDRYRRGDAKAISAEAKRGEVVFNRQCASCHAGPHFTDAALPGRKPAEAFHALNPPASGEEPKGDTGLMRITQKPEDAGKFRTPGLRNVALSAPYMHDGEVASLANAIRHHYAAGMRQTDERLKQQPSEAEIADLVTFLGTLTDQGFITNPAFALPKPGCPLAADAAQLASEASQANLHNNKPGP